MHGMYITTYICIHSPYQKNCLVLSCVVFQEQIVDIVYNPIIIHKEISEGGSKPKTVLYCYREVCEHAVLYQAVVEWETRNQ